jgi:hypothetical protein
MIELPGVLTAAQADATAAFIAAQQQADGAIPWYDGGQLDVWDHVEAAMALSATGRTAEAEAAYAWSARTQRPDGSWPLLVRDGVVEDAAADTNQCAYLAVGVWHHYRITGDLTFLATMWPAVRRAVDFVVAAQRPGGELAWAVNKRGAPDSYALLTGSASAAQALRCACLVAAELGVQPLRWRVAADRLAHAVRAHPEAFADRSRFSMDWYYPVLGGSVRGRAAHAVIEDGWSTFVWPGQGVRCVSDRPWITVAESCELVLTLDCLGLGEQGRAVLADVQAQRDVSGGYWTGYVVDDAVVWPREQTTWTAAAVLLAADALVGASAGAGVFRDVVAPADAGDDECGCLGDELVTVG